MAELDPFIHLDQMGEVDYAPGEPKGTPWHPHRGFETVTYMIDGIMDHQDSQRRRRHDHRRRHPVDDRRRRHPAHRDAAGAPGGQRRPVPRPPALGQPAAGGEDDRRRATRTSAAARSALLDHAGRRRAAPGHRRRARRARRARARPTPRSPSPTPPSSPAPSSTCPGGADFNALVYVLAGSGTVGAERRPLQIGQLAVLGAGRRAPGRRRRHQDSRTPALDVLRAWAASRSASRWRTTARS